MGKTYRKSSTRFDDEQSSGRGGKHHNHSNNRRRGGMRVFSEYDDHDETDYFEDEAAIHDTIEINITHGEQ